MLAYIHVIYDMRVAVRLGGAKEKCMERETLSSSGYPVALTGAAAEKATQLLAGEKPGLVLHAGPLPAGRIFG